MYDSPLDYCPLCKQWIALDQTLADCTRRNGGEASTCPMAARLLAAERQAGWTGLDPRRAAS